ncbi:hypothetical protein FB451DRAFT_1294283 [Mycena latifolia]|nr:hypothetical protein FB451DRAFT_1294283 [Mycena latifolia]
MRNFESRWFRWRRRRWSMKRNAPNTASSERPPRIPPSKACLRRVSVGALTDAATVDSRTETEERLAEGNNSGTLDVASAVLVATSADCKVLLELEAGLVGCGVMLELESDCEEVWETEAGTSRPRVCVQSRQGSSGGPAVIVFVVVPVHVLVVYIVVAVEALRMTDVAGTMTNVVSFAGAVTTGMPICPTIPRARSPKHTASKKGKKNMVNHNGKGDVPASWGEGRKSE